MRRTRRTRTTGLTSVIVRIGNPADRTRGVDAEMLVDSSELKPGMRLESMPLPEQKR